MATPKKKRPFPDVRKLNPLSHAELARRVDRASYSGLHAILGGWFRCPAELAVRIDEATGGAIPKGKLRPDLWKKVAA